MPAVVTVNPTLFIAKLDTLSERQLPYATMNALNEIAKRFQGDEQANLIRNFTVRRDWVLQGIKIDRADFATKDKLSVRVHIDPNRDFLDKFEAGGSRSPVVAKALAIPVGVRSNIRQVIPASKRPSAFDFDVSKSTSSSFTIMEGQQDTFLIQKSDGTGVILQRMQRKARVSKRQHGPLQAHERRDYALKLLYVLKPRTHIPASLHFYETAKRSFLENWQPVFSKWWAQAIATARPTEGL